MSLHDPETGKMAGDGVTANTICASDGATVVAINYITCAEAYRTRFEQLFKTRVGAIDQMPGFSAMEVLKPTANGDYLIVSRWRDEADFQGWRQSDAFVTGHQRGFADLQAYRATGEAPSLRSAFKIYRILTE